MKTNKELVIEFGKAWNNLDISFIQDLLTLDFHYASQWVFSEIENKVDYLNYLDQKFSAVSQAGSNVVAELGLYKNKYCLVLQQQGQGEKTTLLIETQNGKIVRADLCLVPLANAVQMMGVIPR